MKRIYAFGERYESLEFCGLVEATNLQDAKKKVNLYNIQWGDLDLQVLEYSQEQCQQEWDRRKSKKEAV